MVDVDCRHEELRTWEGRTIDGPFSVVICETCGATVRVWGSRQTPTNGIGGADDPGTHG